MEMEEIRRMKRNKFLSLIDNSIEKKALEYLQSRRGKKGQEINYQEMKMAEYIWKYINNIG